MDLAVTLLIMAEPKSNQACHGRELAFSRLARPAYGPVSHLPFFGRKDAKLHAARPLRSLGRVSRPQQCSKCSDSTSTYTTTIKGSMEGSCTCCTDPRAPVILDLVFPMVYPQPGSTGGTGRQRRTELHWNVGELADGLGSRRWRYTCPTSTSSTR